MSAQGLGPPPQGPPPPQWSPDGLQWWDGHGWVPRHVVESKNRTRQVAEPSDARRPRRTAKAAPPAGSLFHLQADGQSGTPPPEAGRPQMWAVTVGIALAVVLVFVMIGIILGPGTEGS